MKVWHFSRGCHETKSVINNDYLISVFQVASKAPSITLSPNLALTPDAKRFWIFLHRSLPKNISFQDCHLLYLVRSLLFGSLFDWILLHVGQSGLSTIHYHLVSATSASLFLGNSLSDALWFSTSVLSSWFAKSFLRPGLIILEP